MNGSKILARTTRKAVIGALVAAWIPAVATPASGDPVACPGSAPAFRFLRYEEDYAYLRNPDCRREPLDALKYIALDPSGDRFLSLGGDVRFRVEAGKTAFFGQPVDDPDGALLQRYHAHGSLRLGRGLRLFAELKSNLEEGRDPAPYPTDINRLDWHQAFVDVGWSAGDVPVMLRAGRQELLYGSGRRLFPRNGANVRGSNDALRLIATTGEWKYDLLAFHPVEIDPGTFDDAPIKAQSVWGVYAVGPLAPYLFDLYLLGSDRRAARFNQGQADEHRRSAGIRFSGKSGPWDFDHELTLQWGQFGANAIRAWSGVFEGGYTFARGAGRPRAGIRLSVASGDRDPGNRDLQTFYSLYPRGHVTSDLMNLSPANLVHAHPSLTFALSAQARLNVGIDYVRRTSVGDGVYGPGGNLLLSAGASRARHVGTGIDSWLNVFVGRQWEFLVHAGRFVPGQFVDETRPAPNLWSTVLIAKYQF